MTDLFCVFFEKEVLFALWDMLGGDDRGGIQQVIDYWRAALCG